MVNESHGPAAVDIDSASPQRFLVGDEWVESADAGTYELYDPATNEVLCEVFEPTEADADRAVETAVETYESEWGQTDPAVREERLFRLVELMRENEERLASLESMDVGKPLSEAEWDVRNAADHLQYHAGLAQKVEGRTVPVPGERLDYTRQEPYGVSVHITPWNYPLFLALRDVPAALATGNTVVIKPPTAAPFSTLEFGRLALEAGLPPGTVNVVPGPGSTVGNRLIEHEGTGVVTFTGSVETGRHIAETANGNLTPVNLELGGKSPNVVFADADIERAVRGAMAAIFVNTGQMCVAGSRLLLQEDIHDEFVEQLVAAAESMTVGPGDEADSDMGPIATRDQYETTLEYVETGKREGATLATGGGTPDSVPDGGNFLEPTIFTDVDAGMTIAQEEIFGPVLSVIPFEDETEAIEIANDTRYGLYAAVWTENLGRAHRVADAIDAGTVAINQYHSNYASAPFGGYKDSGIGRESGMQALSSYTQTKNVVVNHYS